MRKIILLSFISLFLIQPSFAFSVNFDYFNRNAMQEKAIKRVLNSQIKYANKCNFEKFISTYDKDYVNADGFNLDVYSKLVKEVWNNYINIKYDIKIKNIDIDNNCAKVELTEYSTAKLPATKTFDGRLDSVSESIYYLKNINGKWKVTSDAVTDETSTMMYGEMTEIPVKLEVPLEVKADTEYTASLEFVPPHGSLAIASITAEKVEYPQAKAKEVFRAMPEDNILERLFTANNDKVNEYVVASIGLTKTDICDLSLKINLVGFGYIIRRVNVIPEEMKENTNEQNR